MDRLTLSFALGLLFVLALAGPARAGDPPPILDLPEASGLVLDGTLDEVAWADAPAVPVGEIEVPQVDGRGRRTLRPTVRVLLADRFLWLGIEGDEPAGPGMGFAAMLATEAQKTAADAVQLAFTPQDPRFGRYRVQGPRGAGRGVYRLDARARYGKGWSIEARIPVSDLGLLEGGAEPKALALAVAVRTRSPSLVVWSPPGATFQGPSRWARLVPEGGWPPAAEGDGPDGTAMAQADKEEAPAVHAWRRFLAASTRSLEDLLKADDRRDALEGEGDQAAVRAAARRALLAPLDEILVRRPELAMVQVQRAEVLAALGDDEGALRALDLAEKAVPGLPEAREMRALGVVGPALASRPVGEASNWKAAFGKAEARREEATDPFAEDGAAYGLGLLHYLHGDLEEALALLEPLAARYPSRAAVTLAAARTKRALDREAAERQYRAKDANLPRVAFETSRGTFEVELYEDDQPNTVKNLVWLVQHGAYDDVEIDHTVPFFGTLIGEGSPGYALPTEKPVRRHRAPLRGALLMAGAGPNTEGGAFLVLTGTALHLDGEFVVFGRVVEGLDVVDTLRDGNRIVKATVSGLREGVTYRPTTVEGKEAPRPE